jgi:cobaltochelatase CobS
MQVTLHRGGNARNRDMFISDVKFIPGIGPRNAGLIYDGSPLTIDIPGDKVEIAARNLTRMVLDGTLIVHGLPEVLAPVTPAPVTPAPVTPAPVLVNPVPAGLDDNAAALLELLRKLGGGISEARVLEMIHQNASRPAHVTINLTAPGVELSGTALMHYKFPLLAAAVAARVNIMLVGPAGSGKTTAAAQVAKALDLPFYGTGAINTEYKLSGFIDAQGRVISTAFRKAFEHGGVFLFDEIDGSLPGALLAFNSALANDWYDFPDANIKRHDNFRVIAGANTFGTGADRQYVGRNQLDAASLDRYAVLDWGYDEVLEAAMIGADAPKGAPVPRSIEPLPAERVQAVAVQWVERVRKVRGAVNDLKVRHVVSPRATVNGARLLAAGFTWSEAEDAVIWKGLDADTRGKVIAKAA